VRIAASHQENQRAETLEEILAAEGSAALDEPVDYDDLVPKRERTERTGRLKGRRNQVSSYEFWTQVLGKKDHDYARNTQTVARVLALVEGWERISGQILHLEKRVRVWRRKGTNGRPDKVDDTLGGGRGDRVI